jgi:hypothetical protein
MIIKFLKKYCVEQNSHHVEYSQPFFIIWNDIKYIGATNTTVIWLFPLDIVSDPDIDEISFLDEDAAIKITNLLNHTHINHPFTIKTETLQEIIDKCPKTKEIIDCESCDGTGKISCNVCGHTNDCKNCNGTGIYKEIDNLVPRDEEIFTINSIKFKIKYFRSLLNILTYFDCKDFSHIAGWNDGAIIFKSDNGLYMITISSSFSENYPFYDLK